MKIKRYYMEDWLNDSRDIEINLTSSGCQDFNLKEFLSLCRVPIDSMRNLFLGDNDPRGSPELRKEICRSYDSISEEEVLVSNGTSESLFTFFNEVLEPGDEVIVPFPAFQALYQVPISIGCKMRYIQLVDDAEWRLDIKKLENIVTDRTRLIVINNPHNPIGWTLSDEELKEIGGISARNGCYLLFDEHYRYLPLKKGTEMISSGYDMCRKINPKTYATGSMIKCFGIVGIRIGWLLGDKAMLKRCQDYKDYLTHTIPHMTDFIALTALRNKEVLMCHMKEKILKNLGVLESFMARNISHLEHKTPTGGVVCFPRLRKIDAKKFCSDMQGLGVSVLPGSGFEMQDHIRINYGIDEEKFREAVKRMDGYLQKI